MFGNAHINDGENVAISKVTREPDNLVIDLVRK